MSLTHRSRDAVIDVYQDNDKRSIIIHGLNAAAESLLGYSASEVQGQSLGFILPERIFKLLNEYVEFEQGGNDVGSVLGKVPSFCIVNKQREEISLRIKTSRNTPVNGHDQFTLMLQTAQNNRRDEAFRGLLKENFKGHEVLDPTTGLPDRASVEKDIEFVLFYVYKKELAASAAVIELDDFDILHKQLGDDGIAGIFRHMAQVCRQNLRENDTIGYLAPKRLGLILFDTASESARMVLNRLRWLIAANTYQSANHTPVSLSVRVSYHCLSNDVRDKEAFIYLESVMDGSSIEKNSVQEVVYS
jgi:diguanylate cyclase (GGDEF)-like protein